MTIMHLLERWELDGIKSSVEEAKRRADSAHWQAESAERTADRVSSKVDHLERQLDWAKEETRNALNLVEALRQELSEKGIL